MLSAFLRSAFKAIYILRATLMGSQCFCINSDQSIYKKSYLVLGVEALRSVHICSPVEVGFFSLTITANLFFRDVTASITVQGGPVWGEKSEL